MPSNRLVLFVSFIPGFQSQSGLGSHSRSFEQQKNTEGNFGQIMADFLIPLETIHESTSTEVNKHDGVFQHFPVDPIEVIG